MSEQAAESTSPPTRRPGPFYKERKEALEDAGITAKQLRHWREHGLFTPEKGEGSRYLTQTDIDHLKFLRRLIVDFELPIMVVSRLVEPFNDGNLFREGVTSARFIDLRQGNLVSRNRAVDRVLSELAAEFSNRLKPQWRKWLMTLAAVLFAELAMANWGNAAVYEAARDEVLESLKRMDFVARVDRTTDESGYSDYQLNPSLASDSELRSEEYEELYEQKQTYLKDWWPIVPF